MTGPRPIGAVLRYRQLRSYFQCCCKLRGRPAGADATQTLVTAYTFLDRAQGQGQHLGPIAEAAGRTLTGLRRPSAIERAFAGAGFNFVPPPNGPDPA